MSEVILSQVLLCGVRGVSFQQLSMLIASFVVFYVFYQYVFHPLSRIPSLHWSTPCTRIYYLCMIYLGLRRPTVYDAHRMRQGKSGFRPVLRVGPSEVSIATAAGVKTVFDGGFERPSFYEAFKNWGTLNMFSLHSRQAHSSRRRIYGKNYSRSTVSRAYVQNIIRNRVSKLSSFLRQQTNEGYNANSPALVVCNIFRALQVDVTTAFVFSEHDGTDYLGKLKGLKQHALADLGMEPLDLFNEEIRGEYFFWESEAPFKSIGHLVAPEIRMLHEKAENWMSNIISRFETRYNNATSYERQQLYENSVYGKLLAPDSSKGRTPLSWEQRASEVMDHIGAGQDPVPMVLEFLLRHLSKDLVMQSRLQAELQSSIPYGIDEATYGSIDALPFLHAVLFEALRLVDTVESCQSRVVPEGGCMIEGYYIPAGTIVSAQPYIMHRQEDVFPDPEAFNPERWLVDAENYRLLTRNLLSFSSGPRACIGKELALVTIKLTLASIYSSFSTELTNDSQQAEIRFRRLPSRR